MSLSSTLSKAASKIGSALSSKAGKVALTGAAVGGGSYVALTGVGAGAENLIKGTGLDTVANFITGTGTSGKGVGTLIGVAVIVGIIVLAVFVIIPQFNKVRTNKSTNNG